MSHISLLPTERWKHPALQFGARRSRSPHKTPSVLKRGASIAVAAGLAVSLMLGGAATAQAAPSATNKSGESQVKVPGPPRPTVKYKQISAGGLHSLALGLDGYVYAWGANHSGQIGVGSSDFYKTTPVRVRSADIKFSQISAGGGHSLAISSDGVIYAWGDDSYGQLGDGATGKRLTPVRVEQGSVKFTHVSGGSGHSLALSTDGHLYAWGQNDAGQLGDGTTENRATPVQVNSGGMTFTQISAGRDHSLAIGVDGNTYAWGDNSEGQLGDGTTESRLTPVRVDTAGVTLTQASAGEDFSLALDTDGTTYAWGDNRFGQLSDGTTSSRVIPGPVDVDGAKLTQVSAGGRSSTALSTDGSVYAFGMDGPVSFGGSLPTRVPGTTAEGLKFQQVSSGRMHSLALDANGVAYSWGEGEMGQLGTGQHTASYGAAVKAKEVPCSGKLVLTGVTFGGLYGTTPGNSKGRLPVENSDGTWSIVPPTGGAGTVEMVAYWTCDGVPQSPVTYPGGYTYRPNPTPTPGPTKLQIGPDSLPVGTVGKAYSATIAASGVAKPVLSLGGGKLPDGVKFDAKSWKLSGVPAKAGSFKFTITAKGNGATASKQFTITVNSTKADTKCAAPRTNAVFADVPVGHKFYDAIDWMNCRGYATGSKQPSGDTFYKPADELSREAMAAFIFRMNGPKNYVAPVKSPFADVATGDKFYREIAWMSEAKLAKGWAVSGGKPLYKPKDSLSREAMAAFLFRLQALTDTKTASYRAPQVSPFVDMKQGDAFYREISWMWHAKLSTGNPTSGGKAYSPKSMLTREAMAAFLYRFEMSLNTPAGLVGKTPAASTAAETKTVRVNTHRGYTLSLSPLGDTTLKNPQALTDSSVVAAGDVAVVLQPNNELQVKIPNQETEPLSLDVVLVGDGGTQETVRYVIAVGD